jgi:hypothetical protein
VGPRAGLDGCEKPRPHQDAIPGPSNPQRVAIPTIPAHIYTTKEGYKHYTDLGLLKRRLTHRLPESKEATSTLSFKEGMCTSDQQLPDSLENSRR